MECVRRLLQYDSTIIAESANNLQQTALHLAANASAATMVELLLSKGFDTSLKDTKGLTPLHVAVGAGN